MGCDKLFDEDVSFSAAHASCHNAIVDLKVDSRRAKVQFTIKVLVVAPFDAHLATFTFGDSSRLMLAHADKLLCILGHELFVV